MSSDPSTIEDYLREALTRRQMLHRLGAGGMALSAPAILAACGSSGSSRPSGQSKPATGPVQPVDHLTWLESTATTLDGAKENGPFTASTLVTEPILIFDDGLKPAPHLAESWRAVDPVTYEYNVRKGVRFSDGTPLTADDVAFAMQRHLDPKVGSLYAGIIPPVKSIAVTGPSRVTVTLEKPNATWQYMPAFMLVAPKKLVQQLGKDYGAPGKPIVGTGPFKVTKFRASDKVEYVANNAYWGQKPIARRLTMNVNITDAQTSLLAMQSGAGDGTFGVSPFNLDQWRQIQGVNVTAKPSTAMFFASFDVTAAPWDDVHLRRAFAYALDRKGLLGALVKGNAQIQNSLIPRSVWGNFVPEDKLNEIYGSLPAYDFDLAKAKQELQQSRHPNGLDVSIWYYTSDSNEKTALTWQHALKQIGVNLKLKSTSDSVGAEREDGHKDLGFHLNDNWTTNYPDPIDMPVEVCLSSNARRGYFNEANYRNPQLDALVRQNLASLDANQRADAVAQIMKMLQTDLPYIPIWTRDKAVAVRDTFVYENYTSLYDNQFWINHLKRAA
jgi:peptide/nickel transport system substrate-binding protein